VKVTALTAIKHSGKRYGAGDVLDIDSKSAERLEACGAAVIAGDVKPEYDGEALFEETEDLSTLKVDELKAICKYLDIPATGNKSELIEAIEAVSEEE